MVPLMSHLAQLLPRLGADEGLGPLRRFDVKTAKRVDPRGDGEDGHRRPRPDQPVGTLSGGERQSVAIARAVYFGAKVLILDEPTSALGVKQAGVVLNYIVQARERGLGVIFITHNLHHAYPVGDRFSILNRGQALGNLRQGRDHAGQAPQLMAGGAELEELEHELEGVAGISPPPPPDPPTGYVSEHG